MTMRRTAMFLAELAVSLHPSAPPFPPYRTALEARRFLPCLAPFLFSDPSVDGNGKRLPWMFGHTNEPACP